MDGAIQRWFVAPVASVTDQQARRDASLYALFILVLAATGLNMGFWILPMSQGAESLLDNASFRGTFMAGIGMTTAYGAARLGRLVFAANCVVATAVICAFLASLDDYWVLPFMISGVVISSVVLPLRSTVIAGVAVALGPVLYWLLADDLEFIDLSYVQGLNVMMPALLILVSAYKESLEARSAAEHQRVLALVENSPDGILWVDKAGVIRSCNPAVESLTGRGAHQLLGHDLADIGIGAELRQDLLAGDANSRLRIGRLEHASGEERRVEFLVQEVADSALGKGWQLMARDVEERQRVREEQQRLESQLAEARRLEAIGRLAGGIAHDINNQLTVIMGNAQLLHLTGETEESEAICIASQHSARLISQLLTFAKGQPTEERTISFRELLHGLSPVLTSLVRDDIVLQLDLDEDLSWVLGDATQLEQVVVNLVANAAEAMPNGGALVIELECRTVALGDAHAKQVTPGKYAVLKVEDKGVGIAPDVLSQVFEPFFTTKGQGTGLGLATVHGIVSKCGGSIYAESHLGKGTVFGVLLPVVEAPESAAPGEVKLSVQALVGRKVLVVDDQVLLAELSARILRDLGCTCYVASSASNAVERYEELAGDVDLLITDVIMPGMSGPELVRRLRLKDSALKVLLVSGYPFSEDLSGEHFLAKPFTPERLREAASLAVEHDRELRAGEAS